MNRKRGEGQQQPRHRQSDDSREGDGQRSCVRASPRQHANDLARRLCFRGANCCRDTFAVLFRNVHHQLPDSPAAARRAAPAEEIAAIRRTPTRKSAAARTARIEQDAQKHVHEKPSKTWRNSEQCNDDDGDRDQQPNYRIGALLMVESQRRTLLPFRGVGGQYRDDVIDAARDPAAEIAGLEARRDGVGDDDLRQRVGERSLETVADFDAHLVLVGRDEQKHAVVLRLFAELPGAEEFVGVGLDFLALKRGDRGDDQLDAGLGFEIGELRPNGGARLRRNNVGLIDDAAGERRIVGGEHAEARTEQRDDSKRRARTTCSEENGGTAQGHFGAFADGGVSELHLRRGLRIVVRGEFCHRLVAAEEGRRPHHAGEGPELGVVGRTASM